MEPNIQTTILRNLINDEDYTRSVIPFLKKEYFENNHRVVFDSVVEFVDKYNKLPTQEALSIELTNANIPFISIPLPSSADDHQLKNATFYKNKNFSFLVEEKDLNDKLLNLLKEIYENMSKLDEISANQRQYSDKHVYENIHKVLDKILNEKN